MATKRILTELVERAKAGDELANQYVQKQLTAYHGTPHDVDSSYSDLVDKAIDGGHDSLVIKNTYDGYGCNPQS